MVLRQSRCLNVTVGLLTLVSRVSAIALAALFFQSADSFWFGAMIAVISFSTLWDLIVVFSDHTCCTACLWGVLSLAQLKPWADAFAFVFNSKLREEYDGTNYELLMDQRVKNFLSNVVQSLPNSFLLAYVLMLDLHGHMNEPLLLLCLGCSVLSFSLSLTLFIAGEDPHPHAGLIVFFHVLSQFVFRLLAVCAVCVRFQVFGGVAVALSWISVYLFGPQGASGSLSRMLCCRPLKEDETACVPFLRMFITPLSFFVLLKAAYEQPRILPTESHSPPFVVHSFCFSWFVAFRLLENIAMVCAFLYLPPVVFGFDWSLGLPQRDFELWLHDKTVVWSISLVCVCLAVTTWLWVVKVEVAGNAQSKYGSNNKTSAKGKYARQIDDSVQISLGHDDRSL